MSVFSLATAKLLVLGLPVALITKVAARSLAVRRKARVSDGRARRPLPENVIKARSLL